MLTIPANYANKDHHFRIFFFSSNLTKKKDRIGLVSEKKERSLWNMREPTERVLNVNLVYIK